MLRRLSILAATVLAAASCQPQTYSWEKDYKARVAHEFSLDRQSVKEAIAKYIPNVTEEQIDSWIASGDLECREIDGKTMFFRRCVGNLFLLNPECKAIKDSIDNDGRAPSLTADKLENKGYIEKILASGERFSNPVKMRVKFVFSVDANAVPSGKTIRCWLPFPRTDVQRQQDVRFISAAARTNEVNYFETEDPESELIKFSSPDCPHSTIYMEQKAVKGFPTVFETTFEFTEYGEYNADIEHRCLPYNPESEACRKYLGERKTHIIFTPEIKALADSLTEGIENPYLQARAMFDWIDDNITWAGSMDYSIMENIPMYVLRTRHGDCGMKTLLLLTMCRYKGIPGHFQSGWMMNTGEENWHDWGELYFEGVGWVPVDMSYGKTVYDIEGYEQQYPLAKYFYLGGIEPFRFIINNDYSCSFDPEKNYPRSDEVDLQPGEAEWEGGNIYKSHWQSHMEIIYL